MDWNEAEWRHLQTMGALEAMSKEKIDAQTALICAAPDLLALAKQYASECAECDGTGREPYTDEFRECEECRDIRLVIAKAEGR